MVDSQADEARPLVEKAIRAHGGEARLARTKIGRIEAKADGTYRGGSPFRITWEETFDLPRRYRQTIDGTNQGEPVQWSFAAVGSEGWLRHGSGVPHVFPVLNPLPVEGHWHTILPHLLKLRDKDVRLTLLGEQVQDIRSLLGVRAISQRTVADFYFDKITGLLARARRPMPNFKPGTELIGDNSYDNYREIDGIRFPMRFKSRSGQDLSINLQITSLEFLDKIDDRVFAKPEVRQPPRSSQAQLTEPDAADAQRTETAPARWDVRLAIAILGMGALSASVWLIIRIRKRREEQTPQP